MEDNNDIFLEAEGSKYALVFNHSLLLLNNTENITVPFKYKTYDWKLKIVFTNDDNEKEFGGKVEYEGLNIIYTLNKWYADTFIENDGIKISPKNKEETKFKVKVRVTAVKNYPYRQIAITTWVQM